MLKLFQNQGKTLRYLMGVILFLIAASMIITLIPNVFGPADASGEGLAEVNGELITIRNVETELRQYRTSNVTGQALSMMAGNVLENLIAERVLWAEAASLDLVPTDEELAVFLRDQMSEVLFPDGEFVGSDVYEGLVRRQFRRTVAEFEHEIKVSMAVEQRLMQMVTDGTAASEEEIKVRFHHDNDSVKIEWAALDAESFRGSASPSEEQLKEYFEANRLRYRHDARRPLKLIEVTPEMAAENHDVSDGEIELYYSQNLYRFEQPERVKVRHILFMTTGKSDEESQAARVKAGEILAELKSGGDFTALAAQHSEDPGNANNGGDLGWVSRGMMDPEFEKASFALAQAGDLSPDPVKSEFGYHLIRLDERQASSVKPLAEVRDVIRDDLIAERTEGVRYALMERAVSVAELSNGALENAASELELPYSQFEAFSQNDLPGDLPQSTALVQAIFGQPVGEVFTAAQEDTLYIGYVSEVVPARAAEFEEVSETVLADFVDTESTNLARQKAEEFATQARDEGVDFARAARNAGAEPTTSDFVKRGGQIGELGGISLLGEVAFTDTDGSVQGPIPVGDKWVVFRSVELQVADEAGLGAESETLRNVIVNEKRTQLFDYYRQKKLQEYAEQGLIMRYENRIQSYLSGVRGTG